MVNSLGIDVYTMDAKKIIRRLKRLKSTVSVTNGGQYREDAAYTQIHIETTKSEVELDNWLYTANAGDYVGVFVRG